MKNVIRAAGAVCVLLAVGWGAPAAMAADIEASGGPVPDGYFSPMELRVPLDLAGSDSWSTSSLSEFVCEGIYINRVSMKRRHSEEDGRFAFEFQVNVRSNGRCDEPVELHLELRSDAGSLPMHYRKNVTEGYTARARTEAREMVQVEADFTTPDADFHRIASGTNPHLFLRLTTNPPK